MTSAGGRAVAGPSFGRPPAPVTSPRPPPPGGVTCDRCRRNRSRPSPGLCIYSRSEQDTRWRPNPWRDPTQGFTEIFEVLGTPRRLYPLSPGCEALRGRRRRRRPGGYMWGGRLLEPAKRNPKELGKLEQTWANNGVFFCSGPGTWKIGFLMKFCIFRYPGRPGRCPGCQNREVFSFRPCML